jgi:hypothetical protein
MDFWLRMETLIEKENAKQDQLQHNEGTGGAANTSGIKDKLQKKRKYKENHLQFGFTCVGDSSTPDHTFIIL